MVALATVASWTPEDDLLLKDAVEAGASLESLAKGAVQFSRRFTIREIQDRWYSLLYDPIISEEASACMNNVELSALSLPSKLSKFGHSKERKFAPLKRKAENVRNSYYAMRKRILNDAINSMNLSFPMSLEHDNGAGIGVETLSENCLPDGAAPNHYGFQGSNYDYVHCAFPENMMDGNLTTSGGTAHTFYSDVDNPVEENFPIEQRNSLKDEPQVRGDSMSFDGGIEEFGGPKELPVNSLMGDDSLVSLPLSTFDQINSDPGNLCSEFGGNHVFNSPDLECGTSFSTSQLSSVPELPMWRAAEGIQEPNVPCDALKNSVASGEAYLAELSNSLLNFTNEELYLMDVDGKDGYDKSYYDGLSSLLLNSPDDVSPDQMSTITEIEMSMASHSLNKNPSISCHVEVDNKMVLSSSDLKATPKSDVQMPSYALAKDPQFPELTNGVICCAFNTEDSEIPSNEDVFLPFDVPPLTPPSSFKQSSREANKLISSLVEDVGHSRKTEGCRTLKTYGESHISSHIVGSPPLPGPGPGSKVKCELSNRHTSLPVSRSAVMDSSGSGEFHSASTSIKAPVHANLKEEAADISLTMHLDNDLANPLNEKASHFLDGFRNYPHSNNASGKKMEHDLAMPVQDQHLLHAEMGPSIAESELVANPSTLDQEAQYIESDDDVPYYSDIEAMILDMDLDPDDQDLHYSEEVLKYQHDDAKRAIIRLEQSADSYMQRTIASHGALAILYGRHSKHYIKKPEVILGRATEDVLVDIDLGKGVNANKISRRQAIIKMDKVGSFYLKNLGKSSILVNNKEVHFGQSQQLGSSCLIEIRGVPFIFEANQSHVKQYLDGNGMIRLLYAKASNEVPRRGLLRLGAFFHKFHCQNFM